jgi:hypothetical protein
MLSVMRIGCREGGRFPKTPVIFRVRAPIGRGSHVEKARSRISVGESLFAFAGLWETWKDKSTGECRETYTVITTDPNEVTELLHNRMPVIIHPKDLRTMAGTRRPGTVTC